MGAFCSLSALVLLIAFDNARRDRFAEEVDRQEMDRLIHELRTANGQNAQNGRSMEQKRPAAVEQEDPHGLGFWLSLNLKAVLSAHPIHSRSGGHKEDYCQ